MGFAQVFHIVWRSYEDAGPIHKKINNEISQEKLLTIQNYQENNVKRHQGQS